MLFETNLPLILLAAFVAAASPGPATLTIAGTSMNAGRKAGLPVALGIFVGSLMWSVAAALGLSTIMLAHAWIFEGIRYGGAVYLMYLAYKSARSALSRKDAKMTSMTGSTKALFSKGLMLHLTNPKAVLFFGSLYSLGVPADASAARLITVIVAVGAQSFLIFHGYALLFSSKAMARLYQRLRRAFESVFAFGFAAASVKVLTAKLQ